MINFRQPKSSSSHVCPLLPVNSDGHHVHQGGGHVAIEEEGEDSAQGGAQGPLLMNISETDIYFLCDTLYNTKKTK